MNLEHLLQTLTNEYNSGKFFIEDNRIGWIYNSGGVGTADEAEDRWLSFLGAKLTTETVIEGTGFKIVQKFEINNRIGFFIESCKPILPKFGQKTCIISNLL